MSNDDAKRRAEQFARFEQLLRETPPGKALDAAGYRGPVSRLDIICELLDPYLLDEGEEPSGDASAQPLAPRERPSVGAADATEEAVTP